MSRREKGSEAHSEVLDRERLLNEASERLLGFSKEARTSDPASRAEQAIELIRSVQSERSRRPVAGGGKG